MARLSCPWPASSGGTRLVLHAGTHRALPRVFFLPIVLALASIYSASHVPPSGWTHSFGLGGLFGDTVLGAVLNALPMAAQPGLKLIAAAAFLGAAAMLMHVAGISTGEFRATLRFLVYGLLSTGTMIVAGLRGVGTGVGRAAVTVNAARIARREARAQDDIIAATRTRATSPTTRRTTLNPCFCGADRAS
jgi:S-DNA-T family DNA segregation ATPase FtsK/SpoIIIE